MPEPDRFKDRAEAGERLGDAVREQEPDIDIVLAIPRGGLPLGRAVADALDVLLDVVVASKIGAPGNPEYAIGAVASDGSVWRNEKAVRASGSDDAYFERERETEAKKARQKADRYREGRPAPDLAGKTVAVVDDGVATGSTVRACLQKLQRSDAGRIVLAIPVGSPETVRELQGMADAVVCLRTPTEFRGVGQFYHRFEQVTDDEAMAYLESAE